MQLPKADSSLPDLRGSLIAGKYRVHGLVGSGGMGTVWEGRHEVLGTRVAIKFIKPSYAEHAESRRRFEIEARAAALLQSKYAVQVYDYGVSDLGLPYIVMEYLDGETLSDRIVRDGPLSLRETAIVIGRAARALSRAHAAGVVHRDLKPDNIFLAHSDDTQSGLPYSVKVVDFGIAKIFQSEAPVASDDSSGARQAPLGGPTEAGMVIGTPNFMSPEQLTIGGPPAPSSDLWSLGACAFIAVTGRLPFEGEVLGDIVLKVCVSPLPVPSKLNPTIPSAFDGWFLRACSRDITKRFQTAQELADSLAIAAGLGAVRTASLDEEQVQYALRPNPSYAQLADEMPDPNPMSPKMAMLAGLILGVTVMFGLAAAIAYRDQVWSDNDLESSTYGDAAASTKDAGSLRSSAP